jgi:phosphoribosyl 1,2-cyclic phosphodiesterase
VKITYFGVRGSCPCSSDRQHRYGGNTSCILVDVDGEPPLILDLGTGLRALGDHLNVGLQESGLPLRASALLTHLHFDHMLGLPFFAPMRDPGAILDVYGPSQADSSLQDTFEAIVQPPFFPIHFADFRGETRFHDLDDSGIGLGAIKVTARSVPHIGHTLGYRIEANGSSLVYIPDHQAPLDRWSVPQGVLELCDGADMVVHDAQYTEEEYASLSDWGHSTPTYALHVASEAGARRLTLFHHDPSHTDREIDKMLSHSRRLASESSVVEVTAAAEGTTVELGAA